MTTARIPKQRGDSVRRTLCLLAVVACAVCEWHSVHVSSLERCSDMSSVWQAPQTSMFSSPSDLVM